MKEKTIAYKRAEIVLQQDFKEVCLGIGILYTNKCLLITFGFVFWVAIIEIDLEK